MRPSACGQVAAAYVRDGLRPVRDRLTAAGAPTKVLNAGLAGMDHVWTRNFHDAGGWDLIDGFAFHPGRGNFTPDYAPPPEEWTQGGNGSYWNFLGGLRKVREMIAEYGHKELWLTEAYACTKPNSWWLDTYRQAANGRPRVPLRAHEPRHQRQAVHARLRHGRAGAGQGDVRTLVGAGRPRPERAAVQHAGSRPAVHPRLRRGEPRRARRARRN
ncbi:hypothetical protein [Nonomuraea jabiensis]|uniref:hypothetical protein n=1 Tax=Nonomuraea jabiensis TaxID=882448 RepID=UPI003D7568C3